MIHSENARHEAYQKLVEIKVMLEDIEVGLGKYESLTRFNYSYVGDLGHIEEALAQVHSFLFETEA